MYTRPHICSGVNMTKIPLGGQKLHTQIVFHTFSQYRDARQAFPPAKIERASLFLQPCNTFTQPKCPNIILS